MNIKLFLSSVSLDLLKNILSSTITKTPSSPHSKLKPSLASLHQIVIKNKRLGTQKNMKINQISSKHSETGCQICAGWYLLRSTDKQIKYKNRGVANNFIIQMLQRRRLDTRSMYRSVRYRVNRDQQTRTADPSTCNFRIKRNSVYEATMAQTIDSGFNSKHDTIEIKQFMKTDYLKSFNSMMEGKSRINIRHNSQRQRQPSFFQEARIILPAFEQNQKEVELSEHSLLAPFVQPYNHVKLMLTNSQNQLKSQRKTCQQIRFGLKHIKQSKQKQLNAIQNLGKEQFANIRAILRKNEISQQQKKLKSKRELQELEQQHETNRKLFSQTNDRSSGMQITIFNSTPFNVRERGDEKGQLYI